MPVDAIVVQLTDNIAQASWLNLRFCPVSCSVSLAGLMLNTKTLERCFQYLKPIFMNQFWGARFGVMTTGLTKHCSSGPAALQPR